MLSCNQGLYRQERKIVINFIESGDKTVFLAMIGQFSLSIAKIAFVDELITIANPQWFVAFYVNVIHSFEKIALHIGHW